MALRHVTRTNNFLFSWNNVTLWIFKKNCVFFVFFLFLSECTSGEGAGEGEVGMGWSGGSVGNEWMGVRMIVCLFVERWWMFFCEFLFLWLVWWPGSWDWLVFGRTCLELDTGCAAAFNSSSDTFHLDWVS